MNQSAIEQALKILKDGGVVVYPTDTAYGLAVDATNFAAVKKLYALKGRDFKKPIHVIVPSTDLLTVPYYSLSREVLKLINKFWPGPLTIVVPLKARGASWQMLSAGTKTIGIRYPNHETAQALCEAFGKPITTTSANLSGLPSTYSIAAVKKQFAKGKLKPDFYLDGGKAQENKTINNRVGCK
jgi:L-threonylcarbamoyladenylate synthase